MFQQLHISYGVIYFFLILLLHRNEDVDAIMEIMTSMATTSNELYDKNRIFPWKNHCQGDSYSFRICKAFVTPTTKDEEGKRRQRERVR